MTYTVTSATTITLRKCPCPSQTFRCLRFFPSCLSFTLYTHWLCHQALGTSSLGLVLLEDRPGFMLYEADHLCSLPMYPVGHHSCAYHYHLDLHD